MASWKIDYEGYSNSWTWKIPNVSSIPHVAGYAVQSPVFTFDGTSWTIKLYPNGDRQQNEGHISATIERSNTQGVVRCLLYYKNISDRKFYLTYTHLQNSYRRLHNAEEKVSFPRLMRNLQESSQDPEIVQDDTLSLYLVLQHCLENRSINECSSPTPTKLAAETAGTTDGNENVVGEISQDYEGCKRLRYKVSDIPRGLSSDYHTESPQFSFLNATWTFKLWPNYRMQNSQNRNVEIVLERLESEIPVHHVELEIECYQCIPSKKKSISFAKSQTQSPAFTFQLEKPNETKLEFYITLKVLKTARDLLEPENKSVEEAPDDGKNAESSMMLLKCRHSKMCQDYKKLLFEKDDCDVLLKVKGQDLLAHKVILKARSPVLASALRHEMKEKITGVINIEDFEPSHFSDFLHFLYCSEVENLTTENVFSLFTLADKYEVLDLKTVCTDFIKCNLTVDTFCETLSLALLHCEDDLVKLSTEFFAKNMKDIIVTVKWQSFILENPIQCNELFIKATKTNNDEAR